MSFKTKVFRGVYWVDYACLGKGDNRSIDDNLSFEQTLNLIRNLEDAIYVFSSLSVAEYDDTKNIMKDGLLWELHKSGEYVWREKRGCCATFSAWVHQVLSGKYEEVGYFCLYRDTGSGHVMNYLQNDGKLYMIDFLPFIQCYKEGLCAQTGKKSDFLKIKYFTGLLYQVESFDAFADFYSRMTKMSGVSQIYWHYQARRVSPLAVEEKGEKKIIYIPQKYHFVQCGKRLNKLILAQY